MTQLDPSTLLRFSVQQALVGEVTPRLVAVTAGIDDFNIRIVAYFEAPVSDEDRERISCVAAEVIADFPEPYTVDDRCQWTGEGEIRMLDFWAFKRADEQAQVA